MAPAVGPRPPFQLAIENAAVHPLDRYALAPRDTSGGSTSYRASGGWCSVVHYEKRRGTSTRANRHCTLCPALSGADQCTEQHIVYVMPFEDCSGTSAAPRMLLSLLLNKSQVQVHEFFQHGDGVSRFMKLLTCLGRRLITAALCRHTLRCAPLCAAVALL